MSDITFKVKANSENPTKTVVKARNFEMVIDEPENLHGTNAGPNPVEYLLGALSGCMNVVGHLVAQEMGFELKGIEFELEGSLNPAKFMGKSDEVRAGYKEVKVKVNPDADADQETLEEWAEAVEARCPVSDNIGHATPINITVE